MQALLKLLLTTLIVVFASEVAKKSTHLAAFIIVMPIMSVLAMIWLYNDTKDVNKVGELSHSILIAVIPTLIFFVIFPIILKTGLKFWYALPLSLGIMLATYALYSFILLKFGIRV